jgi:lysophospholipase L1-like esterase
MNNAAASLAQTVNNELKEYCQTESRATFVPFPFEYARDDEKWAYDGLHFSAEGYRVLGLSLAPVVEQIITVE